VVDVAETALEPGDWCLNLPLWGNPLLPNAGAPGRRPGLEALHLQLTDCRRLLTLGDAVRVADAFVAFGVHRTNTLAAHPTGMRVFADLAGQWSELLRRELGCTGLVVGALQDRVWAQAKLQALLSDVDAGWQAAARQAQLAAAAGAGPPPPSTDTVMAMLTRRLGWRLPDGTALPLAKTSVSIGTQLQLGGLYAERRGIHTAYVREALGLPPQAAAPPAAVSQLYGAFTRLWTPLRWENCNKEVLWRLAVDGVPLFGNSHLGPSAPHPCVCGAYPGAGPPPCAPRLHHFWECDVAQALRQLLEAGCQGVVRREHVWLVVSPDPARVQQCVWDVVALAVLSALERARCYARARRPYLPGLDARVRAYAEAAFVGRLRDYAGLGVPKKGWGEVGETHPFLQIRDGKLRCTL
jgi:hypothetical protein